MREVTQSLFSRNLCIVTAGHVALLCAMMAAASSSVARRKIELTVSLRDFTVEMSMPPPSGGKAPDPGPTAAKARPAVVPPSPAASKPASKLALEDGKTVKRPPPPKPKPPSRPPARPVRSPSQPSGAPRKVSAGDFVESLDAAVRDVGKTDRAAASRPGALSSVLVGSANARLTGPDAAGASAIYEAFYHAWSQPSYDDVGDASAAATIGLGGDGIVVKRSLARPSGNEVMDASVLHAMSRVETIPGLTADFVKRHPEIEIVFNVERNPDIP